MTSPYPRDDFDAVDPPRDGRRGAHRAAPPRSHGLVAPLVVAAVVAVAGVAGYAALDLGGSSAAAASSSAAEAAQGEPAAEEQADPAAPAPEGAAEGSGDAAPAAPSAEPDRSTPVVVLNGTGTKGLAASTAATVEAAGWTVSSTGNASTAQRSAHASTAVLYPSEELAAAAAALAADAGGTAAEDPSAPAGTLTLVLR